MNHLRAGLTHGSTGPGSGHCCYYSVMPYTVRAPFCSAGPAQVCKVFRVWDPLHPGVQEQFCLLLFLSSLLLIVLRSSQKQELQTWLRARCLMHTLSSAAAGVRAQRPPELSIPSTLSFCEVASDMGLVPWGASQEGSEPSTTRPGRPRKGELPDLKMWVPSSQPQRMHLAMKQAHL